VNVDGALVFTSGSIQGAGNLRVNGTLELSSAASKTISQRRLDTFNSVDWSGGRVSLSNNALWTHSSGTLAMTSDHASMSDDGTTGLLDVQGGALSVCCSVGGSIDMRVPLSLGAGGAVHVESGRLLHLSGGGDLRGAMSIDGSMDMASISSDLYDFASTAQVTGGGALYLRGAHAVIDTNIDMTGGSVHAVNGTIDLLPGRAFSSGSSLVVEGGNLRVLSGPAPVAPVLVPTLELSSGTITVQGDLQVDTSLLHSNGSLDVAGAMTASSSEQLAGHGVVTGTLGLTTHAMSGGDLVVSGDLSVGQWDHHGGALTVLGSLGFNQLTLDFGTIDILARTSGGDVQQTGGALRIIRGGTLGLSTHTFSGGALRVDGEASLGSSTQTGGELTGFGTLGILGDSTWTGGSWTGTGTTLLHGSLAMTGPSSKTISQRTVHAHGDVTWDEGKVFSSLGTSWIAHSGMYLSGDGLSWDGESSDSMEIFGRLDTTGCCTQGGTLSMTPPVLLKAGGTIDVTPGATLELGRSLDVSGRLEVRGDLTVQGGALLRCGGAGGIGCDGSLLLDGGTLAIGEGLTHDLIDPSSWSMSQGSNLHVFGGVGFDSSLYHGWTTVEVAGDDLGPGAGFIDNYAMTRLTLAPGSHLLLEDLVANGFSGAREALYVETLELLDATSQVNVNGLSLYYNTLIGDASQIIDDPLVFVFTRGEPALGAVVVNWSTNGAPPYRVLRSTLPDAGFVAITPPDGTFDSFWIDSGLFDPSDYYYRVEQISPPGSD